MRVALAHDHLFQLGGAERVLKVMSDMYPEAPIFTLISRAKIRKFYSGRAIRNSFLQRIPGGIHGFKALLPLMPRAWESFDWSSFDLVLSSSFAFVKGIVTGPETTHICYCHSPTRYLWSDSVEYVEQLRVPQLIKQYLHRIIADLRVWDQQASVRPDFFIANSHHIADKIKKYYQRDSTVIYPPVATQSFARSNDIEKYYLVVSRLRPYKKIDIVVEAFNNLKLPLLVIGDGEERNRLRSIAKKNIHFLGELSDEKRNYYLARCQALIHPQIEDFGISAVEAMAAGRPVIAFARGGALETVVPGTTGVFFDEQSWEALAFAVLNFHHTDYEADEIQRHAALFDTSVFKQKMNLFITNAVQQKNKSRS